MGRVEELAIQLLECTVLKSDAEIDVAVVVMDFFSDFFLTLDFSQNSVSQISRVMDNPGALDFGSRSGIAVCDTFDGAVGKLGMERLSGGVVGIESLECQILR